MTIEETTRRRAERIERERERERGKLFAQYYSSLNKTALHKADYSSFFFRSLVVAARSTT